MFQRTLSEQNLFWSAGGELIFPWEKTGWLNLYAISSRGGPARALTSGAAEVPYVALGPDRQRLVVSTNADIDRLHVSEVDLASGRVTPLDTSDGIEADPEPGTQSLYALESHATRPLEPVVYQGGRWRPLAPGAIPASFPSSELVTPTSVSYPAKDGQMVHAQLFLPRQGAGRRPAILFFHGGPRRQMFRGFNPMDAYYWLYTFNQYLAAEGYVVLSVNYRGGIGYGLDYREAQHFGPDGGSELNDLLGSIAYLQGRGDVDAKRLGVYGASYGGLMTALALSRASDQIAVGVDYAGLYDWSTFLDSVGTPIEDEAAKARAFASSPIATIDRWRSPVLLVQADDDRNVPYTQATQLLEDLRLHAVAHEQILIPNEVHDLTRYASWMQLFEAADEYLAKHLRE